MAVLCDGEKGKRNSHENSTAAMGMFPVMLADPYIISDVPRASPRIYCPHCGFTSVRFARYKAPDVAREPLHNYCIYCY